MFVLILVNLEGLLALWMHTLFLNPLSHAELLHLLWTMGNGAHHDLGSHTETCWIVLANDNSLSFTWFDFYLVGSTSERLLQFKFLKFGIIN